MEGEKPIPADLGGQVDWLKKREMSPMQIGDLCPECGQAALVNEEGCRKCYACGYSEC
jgi:ribonucleoside-diphosphate reductase alpha chain